MMSNETTLTVFGRLTSDPELRYTQSGFAVANFTVASTPRKLDRSSNEWVDGDTLFLRCSVWRDYAENVAASLVRGVAVVVNGKLRQESYETAEGEKRTTYLLDVDEIGPSLRYATAVITRKPREGAAPLDAWAPADVAGSVTARAAA